MNYYHCHKTCYNNLKYFVSSGEVISECISLAVLKNLLYKHIPLGMKIPNCALETLFTILLWRRLIEDNRDYSCRIVFVVNYSFVSHWKKIQVDCKFTKRHTRSPNRFELFRLMRYRMYPVNKRSLSIVCLKPTYTFFYLQSVPIENMRNSWFLTEAYHLKTSLDCTRLNSGSTSMSQSFKVAKIFQSV